MIDNKKPTMFALYIVIIIYGVLFVALTTPWAIRKYKKEKKVWPFVMIAVTVLILIAFELLYRFDCFSCFGYPYDNPGVPLN